MLIIIFYKNLRIFRNINFENLVYYVNLNLKLSNKYTFYTSNLSYQILLNHLFRIYHTIKFVFVLLSIFPRQSKYLVLLKLSNQHNVHSDPLQGVLYNSE